MTPSPITRCEIVLLLVSISVSMQLLRTEAVVYESTSETCTFRINNSLSVDIDSAYVFTQENVNTTTCERLCYENRSCVAYFVEDDYYCLLYSHLVAGRSYGSFYQKICTPQLHFILEQRCTFSVNKSLAEDTNSPYVNLRTNINTTECERLCSDNSSCLAYLVEDDYYCYLYSQLVPGDSYESVYQKTCTWQNCSGDTCSEIVNVCDSNPCQNGGKCISRDWVNFSCECPSEEYCMFKLNNRLPEDQTSPYVSVQENTNTTECERLCYNDGSCVAYLVEDDYYCYLYSQLIVGDSTEAGYQKICIRQMLFCGQYCEVDVYRNCSRTDTCDMNQFCHDSLYNVSECLHPSGAYEIWCRVNPCVTNNCSGHGLCLPAALGSSDSLCECDTGFTGDRCETGSGDTCTEIVNVCDSNPCQNGARCVSHDWINYSCECKSEEYCMFKLNNNLTEDPTSPCASVHMNINRTECERLCYNDGSCVAYAVEDDYYCYLYSQLNIGDHFEGVFQKICIRQMLFCGQYCEVDVYRDCSRTDTCDQNQFCHDSLYNISECLHPSGAYEIWCQVNPCVTNNCSGHGLCLPVVQGSSDSLCECDIGFTGDRCETAICSEGQWLYEISNECMNCPKNYYQNQSGRNSCIPCPYNKVTNTTRSKSEEDCISDAICSEGQMLNETTNESINCSRNFYQDQSGRNSCIPCPYKKVTNNTGSKSEEDCINDSFCSPGQMLNEIFNECINCSLNYFQDHGGRNSCIPCPFKKVTKTTGSKSEEDCINDCSGDLNPCLNGAGCTTLNGINFTCECKTENHCTFKANNSLADDLDSPDVYIQENVNVTECERLCYESRSCVAYAVEVDYYCYLYSQIVAGYSYNTVYQKICFPQKLFCGQFCEVDVRNNCSGTDECRTNEYCRHV